MFFSKMIMMHAHENQYPACTSSPRPVSIMFSSLMEFVQNQIFLIFVSVHVSN